MALPTNVELLPPDDPSPRGAAAQNRKIRNDFRRAFEELGGVNFLVDFAMADQQNARVFVQCLSKLLPSELKEAAADEGLQVIVQNVVAQGVYAEQEPAAQTKATVIQLPYHGPDSTS